MFRTGEGRERRFALSSWSQRKVVFLGTREKSPFDSRAEKVVTKQTVLPTGAVTIFKADE